SGRLLLSGHFSHLQLTMAMSPACKMALIMTIIEFVVSPVVMVAAPHLYTYSNNALYIFCFAISFILPGIGLGGILSKSTCLLMTAAVLAILYTIVMFLGACVRVNDVNSIDVNSIDEYTRRMSRYETKLYNWCIAYIFVYLLHGAFLIISTVYYLKARKEIKDEQFRVMCSQMGYPPMGYYPPAGYPPAPPMVQTAQSSSVKTPAY
ncbi:hypothetical protein PENTCL1PPCAC_1338, partial [Pristionchus entomophagus]